MKRKTILCLALIMALTVALISASAATWTIMKVTVDGARVRKSAGNSDVVASLKKGTRVISTGKASQAYYKIMMLNGKTGYIFRDHVEKLGTVDSTQLYKTTQKVNLRRKASKAASRVKKLAAGEYVMVISVADGWAHVKTIDGKRGYLLETYLKKAG